MADLSDMTDEELAAKLKTAVAVNVTVSVIFTLIVIAWVALGYWKTNVPVFVSTITMGLMSFLITSAAPRRLRSEIARRSQAQ